MGVELKETIQTARRALVTRMFTARLDVNLGSPIFPATDELAQTDIWNTMAWGSLRPPHRQSSLDRGLLIQVQPFVKLQVKNSLIRGLNNCEFNNSSFPSLLPSLLHSRHHHGSQLLASLPSIVPRAPYEKVMPGLSVPNTTLPLPPACLPLCLPCLPAP